MAFVFDFVNQIIDVESPATEITVQETLNAIRDAECSDLGMAYPKIADAEGKGELEAGVYIGITLKLLQNWQVRWYAGNYIAKCGGGNLVQSEISDVFAFREGGPQIENTKSASSTIVSADGDSVTIPTALENAEAVWNKLLPDYFPEGSAGNIVGNFTSDAPSAEENADAVWARALPDYFPEGTAGNILGTGVISDAPTAQENADAVWGRALPDEFTEGTAGNILGTGVSSDAPSAQENAEAVWALINGIETNITPQQALRLILSVLVGKSNIVKESRNEATTTFRDINDQKDRVITQMVGHKRVSVDIDSE